jgi:hypothetical protein
LLEGENQREAEGARGGWVGVDVVHALGGLPPETRGVEILHVTDLGIEKVVDVQDSTEGFPELIA